MKKTAEDLLWVSQAVLFQNKTAFEKLVNKYQSPLRRFFINLTGDKDLSNDLSQETFIKAYLRLSSFKGASKFSTWLFRIGYNEFYDAVRSKKIMLDIDTTDESNFISEETLNESQQIDLNVDLTAALKLLREEERTAMILCYMEGFSHSQISDVMNCPVGTVKSYILRGKSKLREHFKNEVYGTK